MKSERLVPRIAVILVAEGIETNFEANMLCGHQAEYGQGNHFSKPLVEDEFIKQL
jgi:sensor c-di-GMP phosphodiesterase-like protein